MPHLMAKITAVASAVQRSLRSPISVPFESD